MNEISFPVPRMFAEANLALSTKRSPVMCFAAATASKPPAARTPPQFLFSTSLLSLLSSLSGTRRISAEARKGSLIPPSIRLAPSEISGFGLVCDRPLRKGNPLICLPHHVPLAMPTTGLSGSSNDVLLQLPQHVPDDSLSFDTPLKIVLYPDPRLRAKNRRINLFDERLKKLVEAMFEVMYETDGVGLSAPQIGVNVQLMVFNPEGEKGKGEEMVFVNPRIYKHGKNQYLYTEGCLSFPGIAAIVERPATVRVVAQDLRGKKFSVNLKEFPARIFQHEYDHLQTTLFFERVKPDVLESIISQLEKLEEEFEKRTGLPAPERIRDRKGR